MFKTLLLWYLILLSVSAVPTEIEKRARVTHIVEGTLYIPGTGACGFTNTVNDLVVALYPSAFIDYKGKNCGEKVKITNRQNGAVVMAIIADECQTCSTNGLGLSPAVFFALQEGSQQVGSGRLPVSWVTLPG
ncbi:hypothetical protein M231_02655 [Tremella mesenterica]|uniref:Barwin domain-containing protein n=1 Tax=Tremella mesenterica TaxID=5217 RepID=A0A4Q1BQ16_TREME|nr:uncharacterized protein TREMEDRAFT_64245 [Tremella mesenterica DSM 1558]EIW67651.1 hypothetical protein TREMEDRAFT_64245 [Tremella mesenterica DSM 1558]RXK40015.1 hypothetical protein M231_02655 [Tremella mesenterica]